MAVERLEITRRSVFAGGESFGDVGPYQLLEGTAHFAVDPLHASNKGITDLELAPRDYGQNQVATPAGGATLQNKVRFSSDFLMMQPANPERGNHRVIYDVVNRGKILTLGGFNDAGAYDPSVPLNAGNGFLMRKGYTVVICGWQADVPPVPGFFGMHAPEAVGPDGKPVAGRILCWFQPNQRTQVLMLSDRGHLPYPAAGINEASASLTVRDHPNSPASPISRDSWSFVRVEDEQVEPEPCHIYMESGFEAGRIYELVYTTSKSRIVGLGFAAMRDIVSFLKHADTGNPCAGDIEYAYAYGVSQTGRFLRDYLHAGLNEDEEGRIALDGIMALVAGGMRGEFNLRFGQPSKDICYVIPGLFPFTDTEQRDPVTGDTGSLLGRLKEKGKAPKIMFINTSAEYWRGDAALIHTDIERMADAPEDSEFVRRYHFAGTQHGRGTFPPPVARPTDGLRGHLPFNSIDYSPLTRAALENLDRWVSAGEPAPASQHPRLSDGTAVESKTLLKQFAKLPGVKVPAQTTRAMRLDYGHEKHLGRTTTLPAIEGEEYPALVSDIDKSFNEVAGIRLPYVSVPVATYTGWNLRHSDFGNPDLYIGVTGGLAGWTLPLPATRTQREASGDPRLSIEELYASRDDYLKQVNDSATSLVKQGYMLEEDIERVTESAAERYDYFTSNGK